MQSCLRGRPHCLAVYQLLSLSAVMSKRQATLFSGLSAAYVLVQSCLIGKPPCLVVYQLLSLSSVMSNRQATLFSGLSAA